MCGEAEGANQLLIIMTSADELTQHPHVS